MDSLLTSKLNSDIYDIVLSRIERRRDLLAAMSTCHALYAAGIQPLIQLPTVVTERNIRSYHAFMNAHAPMSFMALRSLHVMVCASLSEADLSLILDLLERGTNLRRLNMPSEVMDMDDGSICDAILALTKVEELRLRDGKHDSVGAILEQLEAPLVSLEVAYADHCSGDTTFLLANFRQTLEKAKYNCAYLDDVEFSYPKLVDLEVFVADVPSLSVLTTVFPNLEKLVIEGGRYMEVEELQELRLENISFQQQGHKPWTSLKSLTGDLRPLYALGLQREVYSLHILPGSNRFEEEDLSCFREVISTTKAQNLTAILQDEPNFLSGMFDGLRRPLMQLELGLLLSHTDGYERTMDALVRGLAPVYALFLILRVKSMDVRSLCGQPSTGPHPATPFTRTLDQQALIERIGDSMAMVGMIVLNVEGDGSLHTMWIKRDVEGGEGEKRVWAQVNLADIENGAFASIVERLESGRAPNR